jgi:predicted lipoprotein with Yx(FWY)xxD motif
VNPLSRNNSLVIVLLALAVLSIFISISISAWAEDYSIRTSSSKFIGTFLADQNGLTLYYYQNDSSAYEASTCYGECAALWHPFYAPNPTLPDDLRSIDFGVITRTDGNKQTTFKGWPLYYYRKDEAPGDTWGNNVDGLWHVVDPDNQPQII